MDHNNLVITINIVIAIILLIPSYILFRQYLHTKILDYLILQLIFLSGVVTVITVLVSNDYNSVRMLQIRHLIANIPSLLLIVYSTRVRKVTLKSLTFIIGVLWFIILVTLIFSWSIFTQPDSAKVLFWNLNYKEIATNAYHPNGAGFKINEIIIYSSSFPLLEEFYRLYAEIIFFVTYSKIDVIHNTERSDRARKLWFVTATMFLTYGIFQLPWLGVPEIIAVLPLVGTVLIAAIAIGIPEALVLSNAQILRVYEIFADLELNDDNGLDKTTGAIKTYIRTISKEEITRRV